MSGASTRHLTLIGGGLAGALAAVYLGQAGYEVDLFERRPDPAGGPIGGGRSINLAISVRGIHALREVGLADEILKLAIPMRGRMIHSSAGALQFQPYDSDPTRHINSISRSGLNVALLSAAQRASGVRVHYDWRCVDVDVDAPAARLVHAVTGETRESGGAAVIGIDGAFSAVRRSMQRLDRFNYSQAYLRHGYKELVIPPRAGGGFAMEPNALHIWPRRSYMMIALPNPDESFTCTLFYPHEGAESFAALAARDDVQRFFERQFPDALALMPTLLDDFERNPVGAMVTVRCNPWSHAGKVALLGDAAHAVVPFYGQGANASFEDCTALNECVKRHAPNWQRVFDEVERMRRCNVDALADLAIGNFLEMRDKTASRGFHLYKKAERSLHRWLPGLFTPLYTLVSFSRTPYAESRAIARRQDAVLGGVAALCGIVIVTLALHLALACGWAAAALVALLLVALLAQIAHASREKQRRDARENGALSP